MDSYIKAAFGLRVTVAEADLLRRVVTAIDLIADPSKNIETLEAHYRDVGPDFAAIFPRTDLSPFDGLLDLFPDVNYPNLGFHIHFGKSNEAGLVELYFSGDQFCIEAAANMIQRCARSALPFGFEFSFDADRLRAGHSGGGYVVITEAAIDYAQTSASLDRAIGRAREEGADGFVLAIRDKEHGLSFWSNRDGFGRLVAATVFSEAEAASFEVPIADDQSEWLAMPAPRRL